MSRLGVAMISRRSPRTRYGMTYRVPGTTSSRVRDTRPGRPRFGNSAKRSTAASNVVAVRAAAPGFSRAIESRRAARWPVARGDQTTVTREAPFAHASCPKIGATSTRPRALRRARCRVPGGQLESHPVAISPLPHRRQWLQPRETIWSDVRALRAPRVASSWRCRSALKGL
jgi:hypothetical protein